MPAAQPERIAAQMQSTFNIDPADILHISAKTGQGVEDVLKAIVERIPPPKGRVDEKAPLKVLLFDSLCVLPLEHLMTGANDGLVCRYDRYSGVISLINVKEGTLRKGAAPVPPPASYQQTSTIIINMQVTRSPPATPAKSTKSQN